jgi:hypothetical protein
VSIRPTPAAAVDIVPSGATLPAPQAMTKTATLPVAREIPLRMKGCCQPVANPLSDARASELATLYRALGDPTRVQILHILAAAPSQSASATSPLLSSWDSRPSATIWLRCVKRGSLRPLLDRVVGALGMRCTTSWG